MVEARSPAFVEDYFSADEQALIADISLPERSLLLALLWSAKESALKALRVGLRLDTRCMSVKPRRVSHALDADLFGIL
jgi:4'-phosphopantetheinyl transferase